MNKVDEFLSESNAIEGVYDDDSLTQARYAWEFIKEQEKLTIGGILKTHKILMLHTHLLPDQKGYFRKCPVWIGGKEATSHILVPELMKDWVDVANYLDNPIGDHVTFERIHPFVDGNGRVGRILLNWQITKTGEPVTIFKADERYEYYKLFR